MSAVASDAGTTNDPIASEGGDLQESEHGETLMTYGDGKFPLLVLLVWIAALTGLGFYLAAYYFPDLALWTKP